MEAIDEQAEQKLLCRQCGRGVSAEEDADVRAEGSKLFGTSESGSLCKDCFDTAIGRLIQAIFSAEEVQPHDL